jgi:hypothetical protein
MDASFNRIQCYWIVRGVGCEDGDCGISVMSCVTISKLTGTAFRKCIDRPLVSIWIAFAFFGKLHKVNVQPVVGL